jgi:hypothetical protein
MAGEPHHSRTWTFQVWSPPESASASKPIREAQFVSNSNELEEGEVAEGNLCVVTTPAAELASPPSLPEDSNQQDCMSKMRSK